ncbi:unnamed protein product, partial [Didymodactylos carnosus]
QVALSDGVHKVEFEHGTTTGKRVIRVDGKEIRRNDWLFRLLGKEHFIIGKHNCIINIDANSGFAYEYTLEIDGKPLQKFRENRSKISRTWTLKLDGEEYRIVLEKDTLDIWLNGKRIEADRDFADEGTETYFTITTAKANHDAVVKAVSTKHHRFGIYHSLIVDGTEIPEATE